MELNDSMFNVHADTCKYMSWMGGVVHVRKVHSFTDQETRWGLLKETVCVWAEQQAAQNYD